MTEDDLMTVEEVAAYLKVNKRWVYDAAARGLIPSSKVGKFLRFKRVDVQTFVDEGSREVEA
jgi:excisionase family DNA binding protein